MEAEPIKAIQPKRKRRWFFITPDRLVVGLLAVEIVLFLCGRSRAALTDEKSGWVALIALASAAATLLILLVWFAIAFVSRRRFQFGLRSLLALVAAIALLCNWLATDLRRAIRQREAVVAIEKDGGSAVYEYGTDDSSTVTQSRKKIIATLPAGRGTATIYVVVTPDPDWGQAIFNSDFFHNVVQADVKTDAGLAQIDALSHLKTLDLSYRQVTDAGLEHLAGLSRLEHLDLWYTPITDVGVEHLSGLSQLQWLDLSHTKITDAALKHITRLSELRLLNLSTNTITDTGLNQLHGLTHLQTLKLYGTLVSAEGIASLQRALPNCKVFH